MELPESAARALEAIRRDRSGVRFEIRKACEQERWRLKVCYAGADGAEVQLGLLWTGDHDGVVALKRKLEEETR